MRKKAAVQRLFFGLNAGGCQWFALHCKAAKLGLTAWIKQELQYCDDGKVQTLVSFTFSSTWPSCQTCTGCVIQTNAPTSISQTGRSVT
jgi:hypothetical protein